MIWAEMRRFYVWSHTKKGFMYGRTQKKTRESLSSLLRDERNRS